MKIKDGFILRQVAGNHIAVATGERSKDFNKMITLNETGKFLFELLQEGSSKEQLIEQLTKKYEVEESIAQRDVERFIKKVTEAELFE